MRPGYDYAFAGAGLSGLLLARRLLAQSGPLTRVLVADPRPPSPDPVTYAYWARRPLALDPWAIGAWDRLRLVHHDGAPQQVELGAWRYRAVAWDRARPDLIDEVRADPRVTWADEPVDAVRDGETRAGVRVNGAWERADWVFDSRPATLARPPSRGQLRLAQSFHGVWVQLDEPVLDTTAATLLDFAADDGPDLGFAYVLPVSAQRALVMAVRMGADPQAPDPGPAIAHLVGATPWRADGEERGVTALLTERVDRGQGRRVLSIGQRGGRTRPSTGYAVARIEADTTAIALSLQKHGHPHAVPPDPRWQRTLDRIWLRALVRERAGLEPAFLALFSRAPTESVLRFLDGDASPLDIARVARALPPAPFVRAAVGR